MHGKEALCLLRTSKFFGVSSVLIDYEQASTRSCTLTFPSIMYLQDQECFSLVKIHSYG